MTLSSLPLGYCTNVHPGRTVAEVEHGLRTYTAPLRHTSRQLLAVGLWLARSVVTELLESTDRLAKFRDRITELDLTCHTLNAFPFGDFHSERVKENVYLPDWTTFERLEYTLDCARVLAELLPDGAQGSISTVPLGFAPLTNSPSFHAECYVRLIEVARGLKRLHDESGRKIRLALEPEPFCEIELIEQQAIPIFQAIRSAAAETDDENLVREYIGLCFDVCHQSVEFEDVAQSIFLLEQADIRINKIHITCAIELEDPADNRDGREALARYVEPRYMHQTFSKTRDGSVLKRPDLLTEDVLRDRPDAFMDAECWRVHFHVPVDAEFLGPLKTTRDDLRRALRAVRELDYAPQLEIETYTWEVLPDGQSVDLFDGLAREIAATRSLLDETAAM